MHHKAKNIRSVARAVEPIFKEQGGFLALELLDSDQQQLSRNIYWFPNENGEYLGLKNMKKADLRVSTKHIGNGKVEVTLNNPKENTIAFFNRLALIDSKTKERILPAFYDDNYLSVLPGETVKVIIEYIAQKNVKPAVEIYGWNVDRKEIPN